MMRLLIVYLIFQHSIVLAQDADFKVVEPKIYFDSVEWRLTKEVVIYISKIESKLYTEQTSVGGGVWQKPNTVEDQREQYYSPAWDIFGVVEDKRSEFRYISNYNLDDYYLESSMTPNAGLRVISNDYFSTLKMAVLDDFVICNDDEALNNDINRISLECFSNYLEHVGDGKLFDNEIEFNVFLEKINSGERIKVELFYNDAHSVKFLINAAPVRDAIKQSVLIGNAQADEHNARADKIRDGFIMAAKLQYFMYFICLMIAIVVFNNRKYIYQGLRNTSVMCELFFNLALKRPKSWSLLLKKRFFGEKSILTKSDGFTKLSVSEELVRWNQLRESNVISEEEFNKIKEKLLENLRDNESKK